MCYRRVQYGLAAAKCVQFILVFIVSRSFANAQDDKGVVLGAIADEQCSPLREAVRLVGIAGAGVRFAKKQGSFREGAFLRKKQRTEVLCFSTLSHLPLRQIYHFALAEYHSPLANINARHPVSYFSTSSIPKASRISFSLMSLNLSRPTPHS